MSDNLFKRLIVSAEIKGYKAILYEKDTKGYILDSRIFPEAVGQSRFYLELCLIHKWLLEEKDVFIQIKSTPKLLYVTTVRNRRHYREVVKTLPPKESYSESLYDGVKEAIELLT